MSTAAIALENPIDVFNGLLSHVCNGSIRLVNDHDDAVMDDHFYKICVQCYHDRCLANIRYMSYTSGGIYHFEILSYTKPGAERKNLNHLLRYALVAYLYYLSRIRNEPIVLVSRATNAVSAYALAKKFHIHTDNAEFNRLAKNKATLTHAAIRELYAKLRKENAAFDNNGLTITMACDNANSQNAHIYFNQLIIDSGTPGGLHCVEESTTRKTRALTDVFTGGKSRVRKTIRRKRA